MSEHKTTVPSGYRPAEEIARDLLAMGVPYRFTLAYGPFRGMRLRVVDVDHLGRLIVEVDDAR